MAMCLITGVPESGKTVLLSALVLAYRKNPKYRFWAKNSPAQKFENDAEVLNQQEWPAQTNPLAPQRAMKWDFSRGRIKRHLVVADKAGEAWQRFVDENQDPDLSQTKLKQLMHNLRDQLTPDVKKDLESIERQFQEAACVCILIDLTDDINCGKNYEQKNFVQAAMNYLEKIGRQKCPIALVVTKCNTYGEDWEKIYQKNYEEPLREHWRELKTIRTDAVADTVTNDRNKLIPAIGFSSLGLDELMDWISRQIDFSRQKKIMMVLLKSVAAVALGWIFIYEIPPLYQILALAAGIAIVIGVIKHKRKNRMKYV